MAFQPDSATIIGHKKPIAHTSQGIIHGTSSVYDALLSLAAATSAGFVFAAHPSVEIGDAVYFDGAVLNLARAHAPLTAKAVGIVVELPEAGKARVLTVGLTEDIFEGLIPGQHYWLDENTAGLIASALPVAGNWCKYIGQAFTADKLFVNCTQPIAQV